MNVSVFVSRTVGQATFKSFFNNILTIDDADTLANINSQNQDASCYFNYYNQYMISSYINLLLSVDDIFIGRSGGN